jgi:4-hydroxybenzoate polyprenyltransferase
MSDWRKLVGRLAAGIAGAVGVLIAAPGIASAQTTTGSSFNPTVFLVVAIVMAIVCAYVANIKGRSVALWAVLGFFFGLIALIIIALLKKQTPTSAGMMAPQPPMNAPSPPPVPPTPPTPPPPSDPPGF